MKASQLIALFGGATSLSGFLAGALFQGTLSQQLRPTLTPEQAEILSHLSIVYLDDGQGSTTKTIRISDVNVQIVNGLGVTNGFPPDP